MDGIVIALKGIKVNKKVEVTLFGRYLFTVA
jgi:hypothetical protein